MVGIWSKKVGKGQKFEKSHKKLFFEFKLVLKASVACLQPMLHVANSAASLKKVLQLRSKDCIPEASTASLKSVLYL